MVPLSHRAFLVAASYQCYGKAVSGQLPHPFGRFVPARLQRYDRRGARYRPFRGIAAKAQTAPENPHDLPAVALLNRAQKDGVKGRDIGGWRIVEAPARPCGRDGKKPRRSGENDPVGLDRNRGVRLRDPAGLDARPFRRGKGESVRFHQHAAVLLKANDRGVGHDHGFRLVA